MLVDTHTHYDHKQFNSCREEYLKRIKEIGVQKVVNPAIAFESNDRMRVLFEDYDWIYYGVGIHPNCVCSENGMSDIQKINELKRLMVHPKVVAVGETGLDYYRCSGEAEKETQRIWFHRHISLAMEYNLPLILHVRGEGADDEVIRILKEYSLRSEPGVVHCFRGNRKLAESYLEMGFLLGIGGSITYQEEQTLRETVKQIPLNKILLETDCPFIKPQGCLEKRNSSLALLLIADEISKEKLLDSEMVIRVTGENAQRLYF